MIRILFVCLGNICRSPAAEGIIKSKLIEYGMKEDEDFVVDSAGTGGTWSGAPPDIRSQQVCLKHGIDISKQISRQLTPEDGDKFDYIYCMDDSNLRRAQSIIEPQHHEKIRLINKLGIRDPYQMSDNGFEQMYTELDTATDVILDAIVR